MLLSLLSRRFVQVVLPGMGSVTSEVTLGLWYLF